MFFPPLTRGGQEGLYRLCGYLSGEYDIIKMFMDEEKIQKYIKQVRDEANEDMKTHLGALNEMHGENLKAIRESFVLVNQKLDSHTEIIGEMKEDIEVVKGDIKIIKEDLNKKVDYEEFSLLKQKVV